jgi:ABC-2 type transport system ATP-binding protein
LVALGFCLEVTQSIRKTKASRKRRTTMSSVVSVQGLSKHYGSKKAVDDISFDIQEGEIVAILGPNGAGKTTTMEILEGFHKRTSGTIDVLGEDPEHASRLWRTKIGLVQQSTSLEGSLSIIEALRFFRSMYPNPRKLSEVLEAAELTDIAEEKIVSLSGGQQRRVDFAIGIVGNPKLLFLDEPTTGLDPETRQRAWKTISKLAAGGMTTILTTHYLDEAEQLADRVIIIANGRVLADASPSEIESQGTTAIQFPVHKHIQLQALPLAKQLRVTNGLATIRTTNVTHDLELLFGWARKKNVNLDDLEVKRPSLEEAYLKLTAKGGAGDNNE